MLDQVNGLHHVTALASAAPANNVFFTQVLGLRRVKKTVNFDAPEVYHLYYGDELGRPGTVMTHFPFPGAPRGRAGAGEVGLTVFAVPPGAIRYWQDRLARHGVADIRLDESFGAPRLTFAGPDGDALALVEAEDARSPWTATVPADAAIRGFHGVQLRLSDSAATEELLRFMGYEPEARQDDTLRLRQPGGNGADVIDILTVPGAAPARQGAGSVHHVAFSVADAAQQHAVRQALVDAGCEVTPVIDRDYFLAIYFRSPGGVLFEVATDAPGFTRDEDAAHLGDALRLPDQHAHLREMLENRYLEPLDG